MTPVKDPFSGEGEVRSLARALDWAETPLGPVDQWSRTLRDMVRMCLDTSFPIALWCGAERVLIYNDGYRDVLGAKHPDALGRPGSEVWAEIWDGIQPMFEQIDAGGPPVFELDAPFRVRRTEGGEEQAEAWFTFSLSGVRDESGELVAYMNIVAETTRRILAERAQEAARAKAERAEARLKEVFAHAPAFMAVLRGRDHVFEYVNGAYYQLVGHRDLLGRRVFDALPEVQGQGFRELLDQVLETGEPFVGREVPVVVSRDPDGPVEERFVDLVYYPITEADGTRSGVVAHGSDVTEHVLARRDAQRARAEAERANLAKSHFLATMSHEIRTPINAIMGYADLLDAGVTEPLSGTQQEYVDGIATSSRHLRGLVSDILDLAKIEAGEMEVAVERTLARPVVEAGIRLVTPQADRKGIQLEERWECGTDLRVLGDEDRIRQILLNLLSNALKFTEAGGTITVGCRTAESAPQDAAVPEVGPWVVIEVEDSGSGIPEHQQSRIFEAFVQAESGHTRRKSGTGLGLTISRRLARLMGGELTVRSEPDSGSCFSLWLPPAVQERVPGGRSPKETTLPEVSWPPQVEDLPGLATVGRTLLSIIDRIEREWVDRIRADARMVAAERVSRAQTADQTAELLAAFAKILFILEEGGADPGLLRDAEAIQTLVCRRHGVQRRRLGWSREELEREYEMLAEVIDQALRAEAPKRTAANLASALSVVRQLVRRAGNGSLLEYDRAITEHSPQQGVPDA